MIEQMKPDCELEVDGGIDEATAPTAVAAGANVLVAGTSILLLTRAWLLQRNRCVTRFRR
jgi:pentose-5-phosphate-3-epimerase